MLKVLVASDHNTFFAAPGFAQKPDLRLQQHQQQHNQQQQRNLHLPPDGTTFTHMTLGEKASRSVPGYGFWNFQFHQTESSYVEFVLVLPKGTSLGLFARKNAIPSLTQNDIRDVIVGNNGSRVARSVSQSVSHVTHASGCEQNMNNVLRF